MSKLFFATGISLDGFIAGENRGPQNPLGDGGTAIHTWMYNQPALLNMHQTESVESENPDNKMIKEGFANVGAFIMGKRMFEEGEANWPEDLYKADVYVLTHEIREPWVQKGSTVFYFINDGIQVALEKARISANGKDVRIMGGADIIQQYLNAGLVNEFTIHMAPVFLGRGIRLLENIDKSKISVNVVKVNGSPMVSHLKYEVLATEIAYK